MANFKPKWPIHWEAYKFRFHIPELLDINSLHTSILSLSVVKGLL